MNQAEYESRKRELQALFDMLIDSFDANREHDMWRLAVNIQNGANQLLTDLAKIALPPT